MENHMRTVIVWFGSFPVLVQFRFRVVRDFGTILVLVPKKSLHNQTVAS